VNRSAYAVLGIRLAGLLACAVLLLDKVRLVKKSWWWPKVRFEAAVPADTAQEAAVKTLWARSPRHLP